MSAFLFGWNPAKFEWADIDEDVARVQAGETVEDNWSAASHKSIQPGDRAFIVRVGVEPKGIFASGIITLTHILPIAMADIITA
ncbi:hypothetical protein [Mucilaginibacter auburnensis]|uniref:hypothetical protein n=1 Tax=Mucilaginibacter auburnensis TaxID=1457233 RepID=UPI000C24DFD6|nr:hypothetical protein [Mucilaginibacter auburnensis]